MAAFHSLRGGELIPKTINESVVDERLGMNI